jgi:hypothetical protein
MLNVNANSKHGINLVMYSRQQQLDKIVEALLADHDDSQLDAQLTQTPSRIAYVALKSQEL